jgi:FkbM family methyltransferase
MLCALTGDARCRAWLASLENPTRTRRGFGIYTVPGDLTSDWIKLHGQHESGVETFILRHLGAGATLLDIGANIGYFSLLAAVTAGARAVAFEPQRPIAQLLARSAAHNGVADRVRVEPLALSSAAATLRMTLCPGNTGHARLAGAGDSEAGPDPVQVVALDEWLKGNPVGPVSVCKIDTEGAELDVLRGMVQLLDRDGPAVVVEVIDGHLARFGASGQGVLGLLRGLGYADVSDRYTFRGDTNRYLEMRRGA